MTDKFNRRIDYLRVSVTDRCNLRCRYCMPEDGVAWKLGHADILSIEEMLEIISAAARLGIRKVRLTGGEPLVRRGVIDLCRGVSRNPDIDELALTTNGVLLADMARDLKDAGVDRVNVSLDTLDAVKFRELTRGGELQRVLDGVKAAKKAGLSPLKINVVLMGGFNDDEIADFVELTRGEDIEIRFIELMPIGEGTPLWTGGFLPNTTVLERIPELEPAGGGGVAKLYRLPDGVGRVGLISPVSSHFCNVCNRFRLTADGKLKPCLHSEREIPVRGLAGAELEEAIRRTLELKPERRGELSDDSPSKAGRNMNQIGG